MEHSFSFIELYSHTKPIPKMMIRSVVFLFAFVLISFGGFSQTEARWALDQNQFKNPGFHKATITLTADQDSSISAGWKLYFNTIFISVSSVSKLPDTEIKHLQGDFFVWEGQTPEIKKGQSLKLSYRSSGPFLKNSYAPEGLILLHADGRIEEVRQYTREEISDSQLAEMAQNTSLPIPSGEKVYEENQGVSLLDPNDIPPFLPSPKSWKYTGEPLKTQNAGMAVISSSEFREVTKYLLLTLKQGYAPKVNREEPPINIKVQRVDGLDEEAYKLSISGRRVDILASTEKGAFHGVQSFLALMPPNFWTEPSDEFVLPQLQIEDSPAYEYRGFFLDVARNFQTKEQIFKILDLMALYKLNVFHFNLANDEGWRIEIPGLPELTEFSAKRGFSTGESEFLWPYYASGVSPIMDSPGTGFYSVSDFEEILAYAKARFIQVIPEIGVPAHSRAAILAMEKRYKSLAAQGKEEEGLEYRLADQKDQSVYLSAQNFRGNTVCVCQESTFRFYEKVVQEIKNRFESVGLPLTSWHTGGDEVPKGVWSASPICAEFLANHPELKLEDLNDYFRQRVAGILEKYDLNMGGWEEIGQTHSSNEVVPNPKFANQSWTLYAWNAVAGWGGEDMAYRLANAGYPVVICSSANFYFDLAYDWSPDERGHTWSGVVDMYQSWKTVPGKLYLSHDQTIDGDLWDWEQARQKFTTLTDLGKQNIRGVSGQLWTETVKGPEMVEYYLLPKMLGYVERAWVGDPKWSSHEKLDQMRSDREVDWNVFLNVVAQKELPRLETIHGGWNFRLPSPGVAIKNGRVLVNSPLPGLEIRYTDNGTEPIHESPIYREPIQVFEGFNPRFKLFMPSGKSGRSIGLN